MLRLADILSPGTVVSLLLGPECYNRNSRQITAIREEIINVLIKLILTYSDYSFDYSQIATALLKHLLDSKRKVHFVIIEALALIDTRIPNKLNPLLARMLDDETHELLVSRFQRGRVPYLSGICSHLATN